MKIITAPDSHDVAFQPTIFIAGSIEMGAADDWQQYVFKQLEGYEGTLLNPRREHWDSSWEQSITNPQFKSQVEWELGGLDDADIVFMYFDPKTKSPITLLEFGMYHKHKKMIIACPKGFWRRGNLEVCCARAFIPLYESLDEALEQLKAIL